MKADWQPMETAPKDGTRFLAYRAEWVESMGICFWSSDWQEWMCIGGSPFPDPTHWCLLPDEPQP